jgi:hypothetical protein
MRAGDSPTSSVPRYRIEPASTLALGGRMPRIALAIVDLPQPDSPTSPRYSPGPTDSDTPSTAYASPAAVR